MPVTPSPATHPNRESWLADVAHRLAPAFAQLGAPLPQRLRCAVGFTSSGRRAKAAGECWDSTASADATVEILLRPDLATPDDGSLDRAYATALARQLVHAAVGPANGAAYKTLARALGLTGPMQALVPGPAFLALITPILTAAGPLPHACLHPANTGDDDADQVPTPASRHVRCACATCGYVTRTTRKWINEAGPLHCPRHGPMQVTAADRDAVTAHAAARSEPGARRPAATPATRPAPTMAAAPTSRADSAAPLLDLLR